MGDLIQQLPTDDIVLPEEDKDNMVLLFGDGEKEEDDILTPLPRQRKTKAKTTTPIRESFSRPVRATENRQHSPVSIQTPAQSFSTPTEGSSPPSSSPSLYRRLRHELLVLVAFMTLFFLSSIPAFDSLISRFIPFCGKSWIVRAVVKSFVFSLILWMIVNSRYVKTINT
jgi:hypothetical protein